MVAPSSLPPLKELRRSLLEDRSVLGTDWCRKYAQVADSWLGSLFERAVRDPAGIALLAVGGYGRRSLAPGSDLDLLLVHDNKKHIKDAADALWYPIWDSGLPLDHSVRTVREVRTAMDSDIKVALGLLDARLVVGDAGLADRVTERALDLWRTRSARWLPDLDEVTRSRHHRAGDLASLLEPDLKEARGGLRDLHLLQSLSKVAPVLTNVLEDRQLRWAERMLTSARVELQRPAGQATNVLLLQDQDAVASALGFDDADALMAAVSDAARAIAWASDDGWRRVESWLAGPKGRGGGGDHQLEPGIVLRDGEITLQAGADPAADLSLALRVAAVSAETDHPIGRATLDRLAGRALAPDDVWPPEVLHALLRLIGAGPSAIPAVEALDQRNVWLRYLPEWTHVRNRPQRNAYHRFTVDRHLLETAANAAAQQSRVSRPDLLLLGALLHDIGKGQGGDHTEIGIAMVMELGPRLGLTAGDTAILADMVRHHLLLPDAATRRDLDDPATAAAVAAAVGGRTLLELLAALTEADSLATGPAAWGAWKAGLVARLVEQVEGTLEGRPPEDRRRLELTGAERARLADRRLAVSVEGGVGAGGAVVGGRGAARVTVAAPDQAGLLSKVAGTLNLDGAYVRAASTVSDEATGMALLRFDVAPAFDELPDWDRFRADLEAVLDGRIDLDRRLAERDARYHRYRRSIAAHQPQSRVIFDDSATGATIVEVRAPDRGAVLYRVTRALTAAGVSIVSALVSTLGAEAVDVFYVTGDGGGRVSDPAHHARIDKAVLTALESA